VWSTVGMTVTG